MNIAEFLGGSGGGGGSSTESERSSVSSQEEREEPTEGRHALFHQQRNAPLGSQADRRALRASENKERRRSHREARATERRAIKPDMIFDEDEENRENDSGQKPERQKTRREKLEEFRQQKKIRQEREKAAAKPAFKTGLYHPPINPFGAGAHQPNGASKQSSNRSRLDNISKLSRNTSRAARNTTATTSRSTRGILSRKTAAAKSTLKKPDSASKASTDQKKANEKKEETVLPAVIVQPPSVVVSSFSSSSSTGSLGTASFAPDNFQFKPLNLPNIMSTPLEPSGGSGPGQPVTRVGMADIPKLGSLSSDNSEMSTEEVFIEEEVTRPTRRSTRASHRSLLDKTVEEESTNQKTVEEPANQKILEEPTNQKIVERPAYEEISTNSSCTLADTAQEPDAVIGIEDNKSADDKSADDGADRDRSRGRTRSRRYSGIQPDPSIPQEELSKTPARRVKERSASASRRSKVEWCPCCEDGEHKAASGATSPRPETPAKTPRGASLVAKTPRGTSKVSRKSVLPMLSESSPSQDEAKKAESSDQLAGDEPLSTRRKSRRLSSAKRTESSSSPATRLARSIADSDTEEGTKSAPRRGLSRRRSTLKQKEEKGEDNARETKEETRDAMEDEKELVEAEGKVVEAEPEKMETDEDIVKASATKKKTRPRKSSRAAQLASATPQASLAFSSATETSAAEKEPLMPMDTGDSDNGLIASSQAAAQAEPAVKGAAAAKKKPLPKPREMLFKEAPVKVRRSGRGVLQVSQEALDAPLPDTPAPDRTNKGSPEENSENSIEPASPQKSGLSENAEAAVFKTPLPFSLPKRTKSAAKSRRTPGANNSPWIDQRRSNKRKYSLSETKPKSDLSSMFDDIPDSGSPFHDLLVKKFRSSDNIDENEVEDILGQFRAQRLSDQFDKIGNEKDNIDTDGAPVLACCADTTATAASPLLTDTAGTATPVLPDTAGAAAPVPANHQEPLTLQLSPYKGLGMEADSTPNKALKVAPPRSHSKIQTPVKPAGAEDEVVVAQAKAVEGQEESALDVPYFRNLLTSETERLTALCDGWEAKINSAIPDDVQGQIRSVVGQGRLVMAQRFNQFSGLVDNCEFGTGEKTTSCMDLQGFWEMIYFQVEDVDKKFNELAGLENNQWKEVEVVPKRAIEKKLIPAKRPANKKPAVSGLRAHILAKKKAALEAGPDSDLAVPIIDEPKKPSIKEMIAARRAEAAAQKNKQDPIPSPKLLTAGPAMGNEDAEKSFDGGFFSIISPARPGTSMSEDPPTSSPASHLSPRSSKSTGGDRLRRAVLTDSARRVSGLVSPYISAMAKRSISRENSPMKDSRRSSLFDDCEDEEENRKKEEDIAGQSVSDRASRIFDPVVPLSSPVTKTYGSPSQHSRQDQLADRAFDLLVSSPEERELDPKPARKSSMKSSKKTGQTVTFNKSDAQPGVGCSTLTTTPHPKSRRSRAVNDENESPNVAAAAGSAATVGQQQQESADSVDTSPLLRKSRVSLLPGMKDRPEYKTTPARLAASPPENLMEFSPAQPTTRRSTRISSAK